MKNRDYPLAPTYFKGEDPLKKGPANPPKRIKTRDVTEEEKAVISRSHNTLSKIQSTRRSDKNSPRLPELEKLNRRQQDSVNTIGRSLTSYPSDEARIKNKNNKFYKEAQRQKMQKALDEVVGKK